MTRTRHILVGVASCALVVLSLGARHNALDASRWEPRLALLDPLRPYDYFELAEEVADNATNADERDLANQLFGLAGALDTDRLGPSALLALAQIAASPRERDRALAAAEIIGGRGAAQRVLRAEPEQIENISRAFSFYRRGDGRKAISVLKQANADALLTEVGEALSGGADAFRSECASMRSSGSAAVDADSLRQQLIVELALRRGEARSTALDVELRGDEPLIEIDRTDPASLWRVDPQKPWWRGGKWSGS